MGVSYIRECSDAFLCLQTGSGRQRHKFESENVLQPSQSCLFAFILIITCKRKTMFIIVTRIKEQRSDEFRNFQPLLGLFNYNFTPIVKNGDFKFDTHLTSLYRSANTAG
jgi:hypothetical protein